MRWVDKGMQDIYIYIYNIYEISVFFTFCAMPIRLCLLSFVFRLFAREHTKHGRYVTHPHSANKHTADTYETSVFLKHIRGALGVF
jgi:hypothetical protein